MSKATANKIALAARRRLPAEAMLKEWEPEFRAEFAADGGAQF